MIFAARIGVTSGATDIAVFPLLTWVIRVQPRGRDGLLLSNQMTPIGRAQAVGRDDESDRTLPDVSRDQVALSTSDEHIGLVGPI